MTADATAFDRKSQEYDQWFDKHPNVYQSELLAIQQALPVNKRGIEIGVGTGRFAKPLNIKFGIEPSENMARIAEKRGIFVYRAYAENLPVDKSSFDFVLMVTTDCFLSDIQQAFLEVHRILIPQGEVILAFIDKNSELGRKYQLTKSTNQFYKDAYFHSTQELTELLKRIGFQHFQYWQTLIILDENRIEKPVAGYGQGSFVIIKASKI